MALVRYNWSAEEMVVAVEGAYVTFVAYDAQTTLLTAADADVVTAVANLTYANDMLTAYLATSPQSLNGASVKLVEYITAALAALAE